MTAAHAAETRSARIAMVRSALALALCALLLGCGQPRLQSAAPQGRWVSLFNGRNLDGWVPKFAGHPLGENYLDTFRVEDGLLTASYDRYTTFGGAYGHLFYAARPFSHYWLRVEYRFVGQQVANAPRWAWRNNGIMIHAQPPETMTMEQQFPISIEMRLLGEQVFHPLPRDAWSPEWSLMTRVQRRVFGGAFFIQRPNGDVCTTGTSVMYRGERSNEQCVAADAPTFRGDQWVLAEMEVRGSEVVRQYLNGRLAMEYTDLRLDEPQPWQPTLALGSGYIAIQAETHPTQFRRIEILNLDE
jgi:hypothetical protein